MARHREEDAEGAANPQLVEDSAAWLLVFLQAHYAQGIIGLFGQFHLELDSI